MKLSISEARKRLPELVRQVRKDAGAKVEIMVRDEVVAELRAALPEPEPGAAAKKLVALMRRLPKHRGRKTDISSTLKNTFMVPAQRAVNGAPTVCSVTHLSFTPASTNTMSTTNRPSSSAKRPLPSASRSM
jgi:antitoxin (DNA-binding transcriptional repressor) of toxin-antitoxin stability system